MAVVCCLRFVVAGVCSLRDMCGVLILFVAVWCLMYAVVDV